MAAPYVRHGWIVTEDDLWTCPACGLGCRVGQVGPSGIDPHVLARLLSGEGIVWRAWGDGGVHYLCGRVILPDDATDRERMSPLVDVAVGVGATMIRFRDRDGVHAYTV